MNLMIASAHVTSIVDVGRTSARIDVFCEWIGTGDRLPQRPACR
jgi:hypothetical protein